LRTVPVSTPTPRFVIDGTNVVLLHGRAAPELRYVLALCDCLRNRHDAFVCFFDANTEYLLEAQSREQSETFRKLFSLAPWSRELQRVPSGVEADERILDCARASAADVISNDKFRDRARSHRWIWKRRHPLTGTSDALILETVGLVIPVRAAAADYL
jgi:hypothetical protein